MLPLHHQFLFRLLLVVCSDFVLEDYQRYSEVSKRGMANFSSTPIANSTPYRPFPNGGLNFPLAYLEFDIHVYGLHLLVSSA